MVCALRLYLLIHLKTAVNPDIGLYRHTFYINGDPDPFHRIWRPLSEFVDGMFQRGGFGREYDLLAQKSDADLCKIAQWQMKVIGDFYSDCECHFESQITNIARKVFFDITDMVIGVERPIAWIYRTYNWVNDNGRFFLVSWIE